jgi:hypothetical protein
MQDLALATGLLRRMLNVHALATRLPRRYASRNEMIIICNNTVLLAGYF